MEQLPGNDGENKGSPMPYHRLGITTVWHVGEESREEDTGSCERWNKGEISLEEVKAQSILGAEDFVEGSSITSKAMKPSLKFPRLSASSIDPALTSSLSGGFFEIWIKGTRRSKRRGEIWLYTEGGC